MIASVRAPTAAASPARPALRRRASSPSALRGAASDRRSSRQRDDARRHARRQPGASAVAEHGSCSPPGHRADRRLAIVVALSLAARLADRRPAAAAAAHDHRHRPGDLGQQPAPAARPGRRATTSSAELGDTLERPVRPAGGVVRVAAALRRQRLARAAHPADRRAHPAPGGARRPGRRPRRRCARPARRCWRSGEQQERLIDALLTLASSERGIEQRGAVRPGRHHREASSPAAAHEAERRGIHLDRRARRGRRRPATRAWPRAWWPTWSTTRCGTTCPAARVADRHGHDRRAGGASPSATPAR